jgi:hypothetical protein
MGIYIDNTVKKSCEAYFKKNLYEEWAVLLVLV